MAQRLFGPNGFIDARRNEDGTVTITWADLPYYNFNPDDTLARNIGIALLASIGVARKDVQRLFGVSRSTVKRILSVWRTSGAEGLKDYHQGAPGLDTQIRQFVIDLFKELEGRRGYQRMILEAVKDRCDKGEFDRSISRQTLHLILREYRRQRALLAAENKERARRKEEQNQQAEAAAEEQPGDGQAELAEQAAGADEPRAVDCGGAVATAVFVQEFGTMGSIAQGCGESQGEERFSNREMAFAYVALNAAKVAVVEQDFKGLPSYLMGGILGREKLPSLSLYRSRIPKVVEAMDIQEVIRQTARRMKGVFPFSPVLYVDGHFVPYYGEAAVLGGYSSQRRMVVGGREYFWVHEENGLPVYATISDGYRKMRFYLERLSEDLKWIYGAKKRELLLIFDRGGYSKGFCVGISDEVRFICWRTDARMVPRVPRWEKVELWREGNEWGEPRRECFGSWEREVEFRVGQKRRVFREVWIRKGRKLSPALTNDEAMPLAEVVRKLLSRWGRQENGFKKLKAHGIDRIHSYLKEPYSEEYLYESGLEDREEGIRREVDNPVLKALKGKMRTLKGRIDRQRDVYERAQKKGQRARLRKIASKLSYLKRRMAALKEAKSKEPEKVLLYQIIQEKGIERIKPEKKLFFDWLKMSALWSRRRIVEIVRPYYRDLRDVEKFVDGILRSRTYVRTSDGVMYVEFPNQHSTPKQQALGRLCEELNQCGEIDIGLRIHKIVFSVR